MDRSVDEDEVRRLARKAIDEHRPLLDRLRNDDGSRSERLDAVLDAELPRYGDAATPARRVTDPGPVVSPPPT